MKNSYNTIVIGASVAGLNAARHLEKDCIVLDKKEEIGVPAKCAECISLEALIREKLDPDPDWVASYIDWIKKIMPNGKCWGKRRDKACAVILNRTNFEKFLSKSVKWEIKLDARVNKIEKDEGKWRITTTNGEIFHSKYIVGADGPLSLVARKVFNKKHRTIPAINYEILFKENKVKTNELIIYFGNRIAPKGYAWLFPTSDHSANIGVGVKENVKKVRKYYTDFLNTIVKPSYGDFKTGENKSGIIPIDGFSHPVFHDNAFLVGDAGSFTDPIFSGGVNMALLTGRLCADSINNQRPEDYRKAIEKWPFKGRDLYAAQEIFYNLDDDALNLLTQPPPKGDVSRIDVGDREQMISFINLLNPELMKIKKFAKTWELAEKYLW